jgi:hypothetical protein
MAATGLGADGYIRIQKESTYGTAVTNSMTDLAAMPESGLSVNIEAIENANVISSRLKQAPNTGRNILQGAIKADIPPTQIGEFLNLLLGAATTSGPTDTTAYTHYWLQDLSGTQVTNSATIQQAMGGDLGETFDGCTLTALTIEGEVGSNLTVSFDVVSQGYATDVARVSSFSYTSDIPYNFATAVININPDGVSAFNEANVNNFSLSIDLGYDKERFKMGSAELVQPVYNSIPAVTFSMNIDADQKYVDYARAHTNINTTLTLTHPTLVAGAASTYYSMTVEIPGGRINPETKIEGSYERATMDVEMDCSIGGTSSNSVSDVQFEIGLVDATSAYS